MGRKRISHMIGSKKFTIIKIPLTSSEFGKRRFNLSILHANNTNIIPSWNSLNSFSLSSSYVSDDFFGMMDTGEGTMTNSNKLDIAVGRILADSNSRAKDLVDKIEIYYSQNSFSDWRNKIIVV